MELVSRCVECGLAEPESLASLGGSAPGVVDGILSTWDKTVVSMCSFPCTDEDDLPITQQLLHDFLDEGYNDDDINKSEVEMSDNKPQQDEDIQVAEEQEGNECYKSKGHS